MKNIVIIITAASVFMGCGKDTGEVSTPLPATAAHGAAHGAAPAKRFEPEHKGTEKAGTVALNGGAYTVITQFTDAVVYKQEAVNQNGQPDLLNYREQLVHLINGKDTIKLNKALFKKQLPDYDSMILQGVLLNHKLKTGVVPLIVYFCMPDSDYCFHFDVSLNPQGGIIMKEINESDFEGYVE